MSLQATNNFSASDSGKPLSSSFLLDLYTSYYLDNLKNSNFTIINPLSKTVLGIDNYLGYKIGYKTEDGQQFVLEIWTIHNNKIYGLKYTAQLNDYLSYFSLVKIMMDSFEMQKGKFEDKKSLNNTNSSNSNNNSSKNYSYQINSNNGTEKNDLARSTIESLKQYAFSKINKDRQQYGQHPVNISNNKAAQYHANNVLSTMYMSHLTTNGQKPYILYSMFDGTGKLRQNVSCYW